MIARLFHEHVFVCSLGAASFYMGCGASPDASIEQAAQKSVTAAGSGNSNLRASSAHPLVTDGMLHCDDESGVPSRYRVTEVPTLGGPLSVAVDVNRAGLVVGSADVDLAVQHAFAFSRGTLADLGTLGGRNSFASAVNSRGMIAGTSDYSDGRSHAFVYRAGVMEDLNGDFLLSFATAINDRPQIVGSAEDADGRTHAVLWEQPPRHEPSPCSDAGTPSPSTAWVAKDLGEKIIAAAINNRGDVTGGVITPTGVHAMIWEKGAILDLGTGGATFSEGAAINDARDVAGYTENPDHAVVWRRRVLHDLGTLGGPFSEAYDIDDEGRVVGSSSESASGNGRAFLFARGVMIDLNTRIAPGTGWLLHTAHAISNDGTIVGYGELNGQGRGFILTPAHSRCAPHAHEAFETERSTQAP